MIDIHSHIIHGVDDGPVLLDEAEKMVYEAERMGIKVIVATPHIKDNLKSIPRIKENYRQLVNRVRDCDVSIKLGYEVLLSSAVIEMLQDINVITLSGSGYILVELPASSIPDYVMELIFKLQTAGVTPILAHPERNASLCKDPDLVNRFIERECLIQIDAGSIAGAYGDKARKTAQRLIEEDKADIVASDAHDMRAYSRWYMKAYNTVIKWRNGYHADRLFCSGPRLVLDAIKKNTIELV